jgi:hypothetical protein
MKYNRRICLAVLLTCSVAVSVLASEDREGSPKGKSSSILGPVTNSAYLKECGACHFAFQPQLLPKRSWEKIMGSLENHFGDSATLDEATRSGILDYLVKNSADKSSSKVSGKLLASIGKSEAPIRITDTGYFKRKHDEVRAAVFKRKSIGTASNCVACHLTAEKGDFDEHKVKIPKN